MLHAACRAARVANGVVPSERSDDSRAQRGHEAALCSHRFLLSAFGQIGSLFLEFCRRILALRGGCQLGCPDVLFGILRAKEVSSKVFDKKSREKPRVATHRTRALCASSDRPPALAPTPRKTRTWTRTTDLSSAERSASHASMLRKTSETFQSSEFERAQVTVETTARFGKEGEFGKEAYASVGATNKGNPRSMCTTQKGQQGTWLRAVTPRRQPRQRRAHRRRGAASGDGPPPLKPFASSLSKRLPWFPAVQAPPTIWRAK